MTLTANTQEYNALKEYLPLDTQVVSAEELGTDFVVNGLEKSRMYERKELKDFLASIHDGRIFEQLKDLSNNKNAYEPFIILEGLGFYDWTIKKWMRLDDYFVAHPERKVSFFEALTVFRAFGVGLVLTFDKADTALYLTHQNLKLGKPKEKRSYPLRSGMKRDWSIETKRLYLYEAVGVEFAKALSHATLREWLSSPLSKDELMTKLPKNYASGKTIPSKHLEEFVELLGFT
jgi:ERCC4-type nuclease